MIEGGYDVAARRRVVCILGTRPEAIKVAPIVLELAATADLEPVVVSTGQHREMLRQVLDSFGLTVDADLDLCAPGQRIEDLTAEIVRRLTPLLAASGADAVLVQGDTTTTFAGALAASYAQVPVVHLEAGLRTGDLLSPFPEELNRRLTTRLASLHLAPTAAAAAQLRCEGVNGHEIVVTGNSVIDALHLALSRDAADRADDPPWCRDAAADPRRRLLVTAHRRESWGEPMERIGAAIARLAADRPDLLVLVPIHANPVVRQAIVPAVEGLDNVWVREPLHHGAFCRLLSAADVVLTDSGGIQEEAPSLGKPVLVMRENTERPEAIAAGTARLVGTDVDRIVKEVEVLLDNPAAYAAMANVVNPYGDGHAARRAVAAMRRMMGAELASDEFAGAVGAAR